MKKSKWLKSNIRRTVRKNTRKYQKSETQLMIEKFAGRNSNAYQSMKDFNLMGSMRGDYVAINNNPKETLYRKQKYHMF